VFDLYRVNTQIEKCLNKKVWLKSGGYLIIEKTEALTVIDVNTGKFTGNLKLDETVYKTNIEAAIKRASGKDAADFTEVNYEGKGPHGVLVFIECATDNTTRTVANVKSYFNKVGGGLVPTGSLEFMFSRKAVFEFEKKEDMDLEELELELIDAGLEEIEEHDGVVYAYADYTSFGDLNHALENLKIDVQKALLKRFPNDPVEFPDEQLEEIEKMLDKLDEDDDVQAVYTNIA